MRTLLLLVLALSLGAPASRAQLEECPTLPQEGEGYYPAFAPPFNVDSTNGGWSSDPPRFQTLETDGAELCGALFRYQDDGGAIRSDEDWFVLMALGMPIWLLRVWTEDDRPLHYQLTNHEGYLEDCGTLFSGFFNSITAWDGFHHVGLSLEDGPPPGQEVSWRLQLVYAGTWDPFFPDNETPASAEFISLPYEGTTSNSAACDLSESDLDPSHLWQPWQGDFDLQHTARGGDVWYRFHLDGQELLQIDFTSGYQGDLLIYAAQGGEMGDLILGGSAACQIGLDWMTLFPAGDYFVAVAGTETQGMGLLQIQPVDCLPPADLRIRRLGAAIELSWEAVSGATRYRVLGGALPSSLSEIAVVSAPAFVEPQALARSQRWYRVTAICE